MLKQHIDNVIVLLSIVVHRMEQWLVLTRLLFKERRLVVKYLVCDVLYVWAADLEVLDPVVACTVHILKSYKFDRWCAVQPLNSFVLELIFNTGKVGKTLGEGLKLFCVYFV